MVMGYYLATWTDALSLLPISRNGGPSGNTASLREWTLTLHYPQGKHRRQIFKKTDGTHLQQKRDKETVNKQIHSERECTIAYR